MKHIILDTDLGGDPDDLFTLIFALNSPELNIDLIVTNDEHKGDRVRFTKKFFQIFAKEAPIVAGLDKGYDKCFVVGDMIKETNFEVQTNFVEQIKEVVEKNDLTYYVCIGPQSNLAKFIQTHPELQNKVEILIMGGAINYRHETLAEHNIRYDVEAAITVFNSNWKKKYVISDITFTEKIKIAEDTEFYKKLVALNNSFSKFLIESMQCFFKALFPATMMHDPLTLSCLINEHLIKFETKKLSMDEKGIMKLNEEGKDIVVSTYADYEKFWKLFEERILQ